LDFKQILKPVSILPFFLHTMSAVSSAPAKNRKAWRDRPDTVLISVRCSTQPWLDWRWTSFDRVILSYQVLGTRAECEASNGGAPVDPGVYGPETILTAWDLGLSQRRLRCVLNYRPPPHTFGLAPYERSCERYEKKIAQAIMDHFIPDTTTYRHNGCSGIGKLWVDYDA
jgi:hypothetical protein